MKMYKVTASDDAKGVIVVVWFSSLTKAKQFVKNEGDNPTLEPVEFPTGKKAIIEWLNGNFNRDNG